MDAYQDARAFLAQVMALYKTELTSLERDIWISMIDEFGHSSIIKFLTVHIQTSQFSPKPADCIRALKPGMGTSEAAMDELVKAVIKYGPYRIPRFADVSLGPAIEAMGGWLKVNETLPEPSNRMEFEAFFKRFDVAYRKVHAHITYSQSTSLLQNHRKSSGGALGYQV